MTTDTLTFKPLRMAFNGAASVLRQIGLTLVNASSAASCAREVEYLSSLSDDELARRGIEREDIVHHAFRRYTST